MSPLGQKPVLPTTYCLWGWLKNEVYKIKGDTWDELIQHINNTADNIKKRMEQLSAKQDLFVGVVKIIRSR